MLVRETAISYNSIDFLFGGTLSVPSLCPSDASNNVIRRVSPAGFITTVVGQPPPAAAGFVDGVAATSATLNNPVAVVVDASLNWIVCENYNRVVRKVTVSTGIINVIAGIGTLSGVRYGVTAVGIDAGQPTDLPRFRVQGLLPSGCVCTRDPLTPPPIRCRQHG